MDAVKAALGAELKRIRFEYRGALQASPGSDRIQQQSLPVAIHLAAWAADIAERLHEQFRDDVDPAVGMLKFPSREPLRPAAPEVAPITAEGIEIRAEGALEVRSGHRLDATVGVRNHTDSALQLLHRGGERSFYGLVMDPHSGEVVNGHLGWGLLTADTETSVPSGGTVSISLRVYTDSRVARLGYALPARTWSVVARLALTDGRCLHSAALPLTILP